MKLWGGRFTKETNELVNNFNASISFDQKFFKEDIEGNLFIKSHFSTIGTFKIISKKFS